MLSTEGKKKSRTRIEFLRTHITRLSREWKTKNRAQNVRSYGGSQRSPASFQSKGPERAIEKRKRVRGSPSSSSSREEEHSGRVLFGEKFKTELQAAHETSWASLTRSRSGQGRETGGYAQQLREKKKKKKNISYRMHGLAFVQIVTAGEKFEAEILRRRTGTTHERRT